MSVIILLTGLYFAYNSLERLFYPTPISYLTRYLVMLIVTVAVKFIMFFAYRGVYRITGSPIIKDHGGGQHSRLLHNPRHGHESHRLAVCRVRGRRGVRACHQRGAGNLGGEAREKNRGAVMLDFVAAANAKRYLKHFDSLGVAVDYITYRRTGDGN